MYITKYTLDEYPEISIKKIDDFFLKIIERNIIYIQHQILDGTML